jgi:cobalt/nickel transport protein
MTAARSTLLTTAAIAVVALPLLLPGLGGEFKGTDDQASAAIAAVRPDYQPWFEPLWTPPSKEIESLLFAAQAALGAGVLGYVLGRRQRTPSRRDVADR